MLVTELLRAKGLLAMQREATRLLQVIIGSLDVIPKPDGAVRFTFQGDIEFLDRLAVWGACLEDDEEGGDYEPDGRDLDKLKSDVVEARIELDRESSAPATLAA